MREEKGVYNIIFGIINYLDNQCNIVESIEFKNELEFEKEIIASLNIGRAIKVYDFTNKIYRDILEKYYY